jgi:predicted nucleic acid-binding protein
MHKEVVFDTNVLIYFFEGNKDAARLVEKNEFYLSAISFVELLSNLTMLPERRDIIKDFLLTTTVIQTNIVICEKASKLRLSYAIKLPDAIIAATAQYLGLPLITADSAFFKIKEIEIIPFLK